MTTYLIAISIGPVQEFILAGRRTGDLYAGSLLISEVAKAAAAKLAALEPNCLIFPASADECAANKILAEVAGDPAEAAKAAEAAARACLRRPWDDALGKLTAEQRAVIDDRIWDPQINSFLEFFAAWRRRTADYAADRKAVEQLLAGRKALRDFRQPQKHNVSKSPLDPSRDSVVKALSAKRTGTDRAGRERETWMPDAVEARPLRLKPSEWLDAVSLLKRVRGSSMSVPSTADIAAKTFLEDEKGRAGAPDYAGLLEGVPQGAIFEGRRDELLEDGDLEDRQHAEIATAMRGREPNPYFAILQADGDRIGEAIGRLSSADGHRVFSSKLQRFATDATRIVGAHGGHLVYSGGDDVLAFLPLHTSIACARKLAGAFEATGATLSVGLAVVHYHEPLYASLAAARDAEGAAKEAGGNCLHVAVHTRGGEARRATAAWKDPGDLARWEAWIRAFQGGRAAGFPYEVERLAREVERADLPPDVIREEVKRIFERKKKEKGAGAEIAAPLEAVTSFEMLHRLAEELIVFRWMASQANSWQWGTAK
ncbi:MAG TPA: type III-B CRISPR-associated protein Cas10/Cmr2 [Chthonomonadaceae bacterium]|nr:type III-B CRISPR-associated protein Cas10/Cmr2 [Chthonomonadaceae bacterium]